MFNTDLSIKIKDSLPAISESILDFFESETLKAIMQQSSLQIFRKHLIVYSCPLDGKVWLHKIKWFEAPSL